MTLGSFHRPIKTFVLAGLIALIGASCAIPTEDQPQPINREQTTTSVTETP